MLITNPYRYTSVAENFGGLVAPPGNVVMLIMSCCRASATEERCVVRPTTGQRGDVDQVVLPRLRDRGEGRGAADHRVRHRVRVLM